MTRILVPLAVLLAACGPTDSEVAAYQQELDALEAQVTAYEIEAAASSTEANCLETHHRYDALARPHMDRMRGMSGDLESCGRMMMRGGETFGFRAMCGSMTSELDRYAAAPCGADVAVNHSEAALHCRRMREWLSQQQAAGLQPLGGHCGR